VVVSLDHIKNIRKLVNNGAGGSLSSIVNIRIYSHVVSLVQEFQTNRRNDTAQALIDAALSSRRAAKLRSLSPRISQ
jgi:hypothetical protein